MSEMLTALGQIGLVPVVKIDQAADAVPLGQALVAGGLPCAEITFRTAAAEESIRARRGAPRDDAGRGHRAHRRAGGEGRDRRRAFIVSPGFGPAVVDWCIRQGVPVPPGVATPTEIMMALDKDIQNVEFFPAEALGGIATLKAFSAPFGGVKFMPTGGVSVANLPDYLALPRSTPAAAPGWWRAS